MYEADQDWVHTQNIGHNDDKLDTSAKSNQFKCYPKTKDNPV